MDKFAQKSIYLYIKNRRVEQKRHTLWSDREPAECWAAEWREARRLTASGLTRTESEVRRVKEARGH